MRVVFRPRAEVEVVEARDWYEACSPGLGFEFARAVDVAIESALQMPKAHPCVDGEYRRVLLRRFPFAIIYRSTHDELVVVACFHHKRQPGSWRT